MIDDVNLFEKFKYGFRIWEQTNINKSKELLTIYDLKKILEWAQAIRKSDFYLTTYSLYEGRMHIPFFDFDSDKINEMNEIAIKAELLHFIEQQLRFYHLDGYVFESAHGYHVICNTLLDWETYKLLLKNIGCCKGFSEFSLERNIAALRIGCKKDRVYDLIFKGTIGETINTYMHPALIDYFKVREQLYLINQAFYPEGGQCE